MGNLETDLHNEIARALADKDAPPAPRSDFRNPSNTLTTFMATSKKMLDQHQDKMHMADAKWRSDRLALQNDYHSRVKKLLREAEDALGKLDASYEIVLAEDERMLKALRAMSEV